MLAELCFTEEGEECKDIWHLPAATNFLMDAAELQLGPRKQASFTWRAGEGGAVGGPSPAASSTATDGTLAGVSMPVCAERLGMAVRTPLALIVLALPPFCASGVAGVPSGRAAGGFPMSLALVRALGLPWVASEVSSAADEAALRTAATSRAMGTKRDTCSCAWRTSALACFTLFRVYGLQGTYSESAPVIAGPVSSTDRRSGSMPRGGTRSSPEVWCVGNAAADHGRDPDCLLVMVLHRALMPHTGCATSHTALLVFHPEIIEEMLYWLS